MFLPSLIPPNAGALRATGCLAFLAALSIYYVCSSPTPDVLGAPEIAITILLALAFRPMITRENLPLWGMFAFGILVPSVTGVLYGHSFGDIIRDAAAVGFLFLVLLYGRVSADLGTRLIWAVALGGAVFALRTILSYLPYLTSGNLSAIGSPPDLLYLANSPEVMFAALWFLGQGLSGICAPRFRLHTLGLLMCSAFCVLAMALMMQRAGIAVFTAAGLAMSFYFIRQSPRALVRLLVFWMILGAAFWPYAHALMSALLWKTHVVGLNSRYEEWMSVLKIVSSNYSALLFGEGWGARFSNPAVGGLDVLFTHSFFSSLLLKSGLTGCALGLVGIALIFIKLWSLARANILLGFALFWPLLISVTIYASYKSLGFGLLLLIISVYPNQKLEKNTTPVA